MPLNDLDEEVDRLASTLASLMRVSKVEAMRMALSREIERREASLEAFRARIKPIQDSIAQYPSTGLDADKAFFDELSGDI